MVTWPLLVIVAVDIASPHLVERFSLPNVRIAQLGAWALVTLRSRKLHNYL
jgi:hypothetical protein